MEIGVSRLLLSVEMFIGRHSMDESFDQFAEVNESSVEYLTSHMYYFRGGDSYEY